MGQKPSKLEVAESCLKPHHAHKCSDVDLRKLRALIRSGKLSPCYLPYEGEDWDARGLEECPICFLSYPALNRSQCCSKEICTECFLQVKLPNGNRGGALCPFCKSEFSVYFKGPRSAEEKEVCRAEERRINQATLRAREAEEARSEERAMKRHMERIEEQEQKEAAAASQPAPSVPERTDSQGDGSGRSARRRSGNVDEEALRAVLLSLDLSEYIPSTVLSSSGLDLDDALLQQAIQASLREQNEQEEESSPLSPVQPDAVGFSPLAHGTSAFSDSPTASPSQRPGLEGGEAEGSRGREDAGGARYDSIVDHVFWEEVDLQTRPSTAGTSEQPLSQEEPSSSRSELPRPEVGISSSPDDSRGQTAELQPCAGPSSDSTGLGREGQSGQFQARASQQDTAGGADLFTSQEIAGNLTGASQPQASKALQRGFNPLSTMSSTTMECMLDTNHSLFQDILATPQTPIMLSGGALPGLGSPGGPVSRQALDSLPAELSSACVAALLRPAAQAALSRANDGASAAGDPSKPGTGCPSPNEIPGEGLPVDGRSEPSRGNAKEDGQGSSRAAGARGAAFKLTVNLAADAAPSGANLDRHDVAAREHCLETEKADVPLVAESQAGPVAAGCSVEREGPAALSDGSGHGMTELPVEAGRESAKPNTCESSNTGAAEAARDQHSKAERASGTEGPEQQPARDASSRTSSAVSLEAVLEHSGQSSQGGPQGLPATSSRAAEEQPIQSAALPCTPGATTDNRVPALHLPLFGVSLSSVSEGMIRRLSSGASSNGELIAALHSPEPAAQPPLDSPRSPLPAPPQHLKTFLSGGKRYASPLSARSSPSSAAQEPAGAAHPAAAAVQQKGLSFADLVGVKGRRSSLSGKKPGRPGAQKSHCFGAPATLTVGMVLTGQAGGKPTAEKPAPDAPMDKLPAGERAEGVAVAASAAREPSCIRPADSLPESQGHGGAEGGAAEVSESKGESMQKGEAHSGPAAAREGPSSELEAGPSQDQPGISLEQSRVIYEEPSSSGRMRLDEEGGAVLLTNPDGSTQLVLLTSDQRQQVAAAQSWKLPPPETPTYTAPSTPEDLRMQQRIAQADKIMRRLYESLQQSNASSAEAQSLSLGGCGVQDDFAERLRKADEAFQSALNARATKTGIDAVDCKDTSDDKLQKLIAERDASVFKSS